VLNSVNVSAGLVVEQTRRSKSASVGKVSALLHAHQHDLGAFLTNDSKGRKIPKFLAELAEQLATEQAATLAELDHLRKNIDHINEIVGRQQRFAKVSGVIEEASAVDLVEDALRMEATALGHPGLKLVRDYQARPTVAIEQHKVVEILVNLVRNAKHACEESGRDDKAMTLRITADERCVRIAVIDNGVGIPAENLTRIFNHGFTTRTGGHGFGLHSGALAARELGGSLNVQSAGPNLGATFTLELPYKPEPQPSRTHAVES
jgi:signal transduction histidine kinase